MVDGRVGQRALRRAPEGELERLRALYQQHCQAFTIKHLHEKLEKRPQTRLHHHRLYLQKSRMVRPTVNSCAIYYGQKNAPATRTSRAALRGRDSGLRAAPLRSAALASGIQGLPEPAAGRPCALGGRLIARHAAKGESLKIHGIDDAQAHGD